MLEWMWFFGLAAAGLALCWKAMELEEVDAESFEWGIRLRLLAVFVFAAALAVSADATVMALYRWLLAALPQPGTGINRFTAQVLTAGACALLAIGVPVATPCVELPSASGPRWTARVEQILKQWDGPGSDFRNRNFRWVLVAGLALAGLNALSAVVANSDMAAKTAWLAAVGAVCLSLAAAVFVLNERLRRAAGGWPEDAIVVSVVRWLTAVVFFLQLWVVIRLVGGV